MRSTISETEVRKGGRATYQIAAFSAERSAAISLTAFLPHGSQTTAEFDDSLRLYNASASIEAIAAQIAQERKLMVCPSETCIVNLW